MVLSFLFLQSTTVHSLLVFFSMHSMEVAYGTLFISHHPASVYSQILSDSCCFNTSEHLGKWYEYCLPSSMSGILWFTSHKGGNFGITPLKISLYSWNHWFHSQGMSSSVMGFTALIPTSLLAVVVGLSVISSSLLLPPLLRMHSRASVWPACAGSQLRQGGVLRART